MQPAAFLAASPIALKTPRRASSPRALKPPIPVCALSDRLAAAAATLTLCLSTIPLPTLAHTFPAGYPHPQQQQQQQQQQQSLTVNTTHTAHTTHNPTHPSAPLVVGVAKSTIHDYISYEHHPVSPVTGPRSIAQTPQPLDEEARRELSLAVRLVTAVLLGVMLGVERRATSLNLGVRSITLISLCAAMTSLMAAGGETALHIPFLLTAPHITIVAAAALSGLAVYAAARLRQRRTRHVAGMCWTIALGVAMGGACGAGLSLLSVGSYLAAIAVMRGEGPRKPVVSARRVPDSSAVGKPEQRVGVVRHRMPRDSLITYTHEGIDGPGFSTQG